MNIKIFDDFEPEALAMLQALYSRSAESVDFHAQRVRERGAKKFMESYYVGYGHASIGDCGFTTLFIEDVSLLACKAFQNNPLYSGQESSTRYIDFAKRPIVDPIDNEKTRAIQHGWMQFYYDIQDPLVSDLCERFPKQHHEKDVTWQKAIKARAFDIARGFLPAGISTQFSWTTNFRQAAENLHLLSRHPLSEVRSAAAACLDQLKFKYQSSFSHKHREDVDNYLEQTVSNWVYDKSDTNLDSNDEFLLTTSVSNEAIESGAGYEISERPRNAHLPRELQRFGSYDCQFLLDFGSFRDLQRHRNGYCAFPILNDRHGFHTWYLKQLPAQLRESASKFVKHQLGEIRKLRAELNFSDVEQQYYLPLGMNVACHLIYGLPQMVYVSELRSRKTVHPTLRWVAQQMAIKLRKIHPRLALHADLDADDFDIRRGDQDIVERSELPEFLGSRI